MANNIGYKGIEAVQNYLKNIKGISTKRIFNSQRNLLIVENSGTQIQVNSKRGDVWPSINGETDNGLIRILVDFKNNIDDPDFYIISTPDLNKVLENAVKSENKRKGYEWLKFTSENQVICVDGFKGLNLKVSMIVNYQNNWKIII